MSEPTLKEIRLIRFSVHYPTLYHTLIVAARQIANACTPAVTTSGNGDDCYEAARECRAHLEAIHELLVDASDYPDMRGAVEAHSEQEKYLRELELIFKRIPMPPEAGIGI